MGKGYLTGCVMGKDTVLKGLGAVAVTVIGSIIVWIILDESTPGLTFAKAEQYEKYTDLIVQSKSNRPFLIHGYDLLVQKVLRDPPPRPVPKVDVPPQPAPPQRQRGRLFQWRRVTAEERSFAPTALVTVDNIVFSVPGPPQLGIWMDGKQETRQAKAYEPERIRVWTVDNERAGAQYLVSVRVTYGSKDDPKTLVVQNVTVNVIKDDSQ